MGQRKKEGKEKGRNEERKGKEVLVFIFYCCIVVVVSVDVVVTVAAVVFVPVLFFELLCFEFGSWVSSKSSVSVAEVPFIEGENSFGYELKVLLCLRIFSFFSWILPAESRCCNYVYLFYSGNWRGSLSWKLCRKHTAVCG